MPARASVSKLNLFVWTIVPAGTLVCTYAVADLLRRPASPEWFVLLSLVVTAGWATLRVPSMPIKISISDIFTILTVLMIGPSAGALTAALDGLVLSLRRPRARSTPSHVLFNMACLAIATWVAGQAYASLAGPQPLHGGAQGAVRLLALMTVFGALHFGLNAAMVAVAIALERRASIRVIWREHFSSLWIASLVSVFAAMLIMVVWRTDMMEGLILMAPLPVILHVGMRHVLGRTEDQVAHLRNVNRVYMATIEALAQAVDAKDHVTHDHVRRVQENSLRLATSLGIRDEAQLQAIKAAALLHDIGKIAIPEHILHKPGRLTAAEFDIMKRHAAIGADILAVIEFPYPLVPIVRHHHENWDGTGYPDGLAADRIPIGACILQVVDCYDALTSDRPYRLAMTPEEARRIISERSGTMYSPRVVEAMLALPISELQSAPKAVPGQGALPRPGDVRDVSWPALDGLSMMARLGDAVWSHLQPHLPAAAFVFYVYDMHSDALRPANQAGVRVVTPPASIAVGERVSGWVAATGRAAVNSDPQLDLDQGERDVPPLRSALAVPVMGGGQIIGVLAFYAEAPDAFSEAHQRFVESAARLMGQVQLVAPPSVAPMAYLGV